MCRANYGKYLNKQEWSQMNESLKSIVTKVSTYLQQAAVAEWTSIKQTQTHSLQQLFCAAKPQTGRCWNRTYFSFTDEYLKGGAEISRGRHM